MTGTVKWFNNQKGYGFITSCNKDYFVHHSGIDKQGFRTLEDGQEVEFDIKETDRGLVAVNVKEI